MAESCSSNQNNHIGWDDFLSDDLVILHCEKVESSIKVKQENAIQNATSSHPYESGQDKNNSNDSANIEDELLDFCKNQQNPRTAAKTRRESERFLSFLLDQGEHRSPEQLPPKTLDPYIGKFLKELKKEKTGEEYEPDTITSYHRYHLYHYDVFRYF